MEPIRVTHVSTYDTRGGAGIAATRLHSALNAAGANSSHLVRFKSSDDPYTYLVDVEEMEDGNEAIIARAIQNEYIDKQRTTISNTLFSLGYPGIDIAEHPVIARCDIINLHWISSFLSLESIGLLLALGKPVVWTLHDQYAFTGGCHYSAGCLGYIKECADCPQLLADPYGLTTAKLKDRITTFTNSNPFLIITPSEWMRQCALSSQVFREAEVVTIPNSVPIDKFTPGSRNEARLSLGGNPKSPWILFGAENHHEKRKGFFDLMSALEALLCNRFTAEIIKQATIVCFGEPAEELKSTGLNVLSLGNIEDDKSLIKAYVAADIFVLPSSEDNFPNTVLESLACGTPVLAYDVGGIREAVCHGLTGWLVPKGDCKALGQALIEILTTPNRLQSWGGGARKDVEERFAPQIQSRRYLECYTDFSQRISQLSGGKKHSTYKNWKPSICIARQNYFESVFYPILNTAVLPAYVNLVRRQEISEIDSALRGEQIETLTRQLKESETDRNTRGEQIEALTKWLKESETDRNTRGEQIEALTKWLKESEADRNTLGEQIETLTKWLKESEADRNTLGEQIETLTKWLKESEADCNTRGEQIETLTKWLKESEADRNTRGEQIETLTKWLKDSEADRNVSVLLAEAVKVLLSHQTFKLTSQVFRWPEKNKINELLKKYER